MKKFIFVLLLLAAPAAVAQVDIGEIPTITPLGQNRVTFTNSDLKIPFSDWPIIGDCDLCLGVADQYIPFGWLTNPIRNGLNEVLDISQLAVNEGFIAPVNTFTGFINDELIPIVEESGNFVYDEVKGIEDYAQAFGDGKTPLATTAVDIISDAYGTADPVSAYYAAVNAKADEVDLPTDPYIAGEMLNTEARLAVLMSASYSQLKAENDKIVGEIVGDNIDPDLAQRLRAEAVRVREEETLAVAITGLELICKSRVCSKVPEDILTAFDAAGFTTFALGKYKVFEDATQSMGFINTEDPMSSPNAGTQQAYMAFAASIGQEMTAMGIDASEEQVADMALQMFAAASMDTSAEGALQARSVIARTDENERMILGNGMSGETAEQQRAALAENPVVERIATNSFAVTSLAQSAHERFVNTGIAINTLAQRTTENFAAANLRIDNTNLRLDYLSERVASNDRKASSGIASALAATNALAGPGGDSIGVGIGSWGGEQAISVSLRRAVNEQATISGSASHTRYGTAFSTGWHFSF